MDLCIKTRDDEENIWRCARFNPCFNGSMYKNRIITGSGISRNSSFNPCFNGSMYKNTFSKTIYFCYGRVSILVLMDLCIKTVAQAEQEPTSYRVSILVLMDLCIKTDMHINCADDFYDCFNPCFNGSMYKNIPANQSFQTDIFCFNPCFNGSMYKNRRA